VAQDEAAKQGIDLNAQKPVPEAAWAKNQPPRSSLMFLEPGETASLNELFLGLAIPSGNDAAVAVALSICPTVDDFVAKMNDEAANLGMKNTLFVGPSGISEKNLTTARDFASFCRSYIQLKPENLKNLHSVKEFQWPEEHNVPKSEQHNLKFYVHHNHIGIIFSYPGADGLKTGYIDEAGYNLAATAQRPAAGGNATRLITVILGEPATLGALYGPEQRDKDGAKLLDWGFAHFHTVRLALPAKLPAVRVFKAKEDSLAVTPIDKNSVVTLPLARGAKYVWKAAFNNTEGKAFVAPIKAGAVLGSLSASDSAGTLWSTPLVAAASTQPAGFFKRLWDSVRLKFGGK
jgi:D-alanyl-D-alanine carboxypeptidase (penicillin-binding protein 5/6)